MLYSAAVKRVTDNVGRGLTFIGGTAALTSVAIDSYFNERQRRICNDRNYWFMRTQTKYYLPQVYRSALYDFPIAISGAGQLRYKSDLTMYIQENSDKEIGTFETGETWTGGTADTTNYRNGTQGIKISPAATTTSTAIRTYNFDLTLFSDGSSSASSDYIHCWVYLDNYINATNYQIAFDVNAADYATDYYYKTVTTGLITGWNEFRIAKSGFTRVGATAGKDWSTVVSAKFAATANSKGTLNATIDELTMIKASPNDNTLTLVTRISEIQSVQRYSSDDTGTPQTYTVEGNKFRLFPFTEKQYTLWLIYYGYLSDYLYTSDVTSVLLTDYPEVLIKGATSDCYAYLQEYNDAQYWEGEFIKDVKDLLALDCVKKLSSEFALEPRADSGGGQSGSSLPPATYT